MTEQKHYFLYNVKHIEIPLRERPIALQFKTGASYKEVDRQAKAHSAKHPTEDFILEETPLEEQSNAGFSRGYYRRGKNLDDRFSE